MADYRTDEAARSFAKRAHEIAENARKRSPSAEPPRAKGSGFERRTAREKALARAGRRFDSRHRPPRPSEPGEQPEPSKWRRTLGFVLPFIAVGGAALIIELAELNPGPDRYDAPSCAVALPDDDLVHLSWRDDDAAAAQLTRWDRCDEEADLAEGADSLRDRASDALDADLVLIVWITVVLFAACAFAFFHQRWHAASMVGAALTVVYAASDLYENHLMRKLLKGEHSDVLATVSAVKLGTLVGASSMVIVASALMLGGSRDTIERTPPGTSLFDRIRLWRNRRRQNLRAIAAFFARWRKRLTDHTRSAPIPGVAAASTSADQGGMGISCSGGGIRSAAFTLGALQALNERPSVVDEARWIAAVSGGSYLSAAWVTGRDNRPGADPPIWGRRSPEEDHLRRHASYLAPGLGGKLWGLVRFVFGFAVNLGVLVLALMVLAVPAGWAIHAAADDKSVGGELALPSGACIQRGGGGYLVTIAAQTVSVGEKAVLRVGRGPILEAEPDSSNKAKVEIEGDARANLETGSGADDAPTTTTTLLPGEACVPLEAEEFDGLPADAPERTFGSGTKVPVVVEEPVEVTGQVAGCLWEEAQDPRNNSPNACNPKDAKVIELPDNSRLLGPARGTVEIDHDAIVRASGDGAPRLSRACGNAACLGWSMSLWMWLAVGLPAAAAALVGIGLVSIRRTDSSRRAIERVLRRWTAGAVGAALVFWLVPSLVAWLVHLESWLEDRLGLASIGTGTLLAALVAQLFATSGKAGSPGGKAAEFVKKVGGKLRPILLTIASTIVGPLLVIGLALSFMVTGAHDGYSEGWLLGVLGAAGVLIIFGLGGDLNEWSLHPFYKERLRFAFAVDPRALPHPLAPLPDPRDDPLSDINTAPGPDLVVCAAANIADDRLTAPGRPVVSWTFTRGLIGSQAITAATLSGTYPPSGLPPRFSHLASTWTAVAVSGAAFSPAMGKMSRPERVLFVLGNLRLGVWYPNPRYQGTVTIDGEQQNTSFDWDWYRTHHPRPWYLVKEALGLHRLRDPWVYVTDGGHYENLGLVELLRRRCTEIYCFDASGDQPDTFGTLSDAIRIARAELEIEIDIRPDPMKPGKDDEDISRIGVWPGVVHYPDLKEPGWIVVAKLAVPRTAPFDIVDLARTLPSFPSHPTGDQLYTDQKFEAYRALGQHLGDQARMVGGAIRILLEDHDMTVEDAVAAVQDALCALPDPTPCPPSSDADES